MIQLWWWSFCLVGLIFPPAAQAVQPKVQKPVVQEKSANEVKRPEWFQNWSLSVSYAYGRPMGKYVAPAAGYFIEGGFLVLPKLELGMSLGQIKAKYRDKVTYDATGYEETREYQVTDTLAAGRATYHFNDKWAGFAWLGGSYLQSNLSSISTTAPVAPSLDTTFKKSSGPNFAYGAGGIYEMLWGPHFGFAVELGGLDSGGGGQALRLVYASTTLKFYIDSSPIKNLGAHAKPKIKKGESDEDNNEDNVP